MSFLSNVEWNVRKGVNFSSFGKQSLCLLAITPLNLTDSITKHLRGVDIQC